METKLKYQVLMLDAFRSVTSLDSHNYFKSEYNIINPCFVNEKMKAHSVISYVYKIICPH